MTILRFVHAAGLHLDSPFRGIRNEAPPRRRCPQQHHLQRRTQMDSAFRSRTSTVREPSPVAGPRHR